MCFSSIISALNDILMRIFFWGYTMFWMLTQGSLCCQKQPVLYSERIIRFPTLYWAMLDTHVWFLWCEANWDRTFQFCNFNYRINLHYLSLCKSSYYMEYCCCLSRRAECPDYTNTIVLGQCLILGLILYKLYIYILFTELPFGFSYE